VFVKTGVSRQADLVEIVAGFATPLIGKSVMRTGWSPSPRSCGERA
jgi:hypothetical protein